MFQFAGEWFGQGEAALLLFVILLATVGTGLLFVLSLTATRRRRTVPYGLLTVAIGLLVVRSLVGVGTVLGRVPMTVHHLTGHTVDFLIAVLVLGAVYAVGNSFGSD